MLFQILLLVLIFVVPLLIMKRKKRMSLLKDFGIPGPKPHLIFGNLKELNNKGLHIALRDWEKEYGKIFGYYLGCMPTIVINDVELCKKVQIKDFNNFVNRPIFLHRNKSKFGQHIVTAVDDKWKAQRALMTPSFTTGKLKLMYKLVYQSIDVFLSKMDSASKKGTEINILEFFKTLTLDVIAKAAFGVETTVQTNPDDIFYRGAQDVIREDSFKGLAAFGLCFPELSTLTNILFDIMSRINLFLGTNMIRGFLDTCEKVVLARRSNLEHRREDLLQLLLDAEIYSDIKDVSGHNLTVDYESDAPEELKSDDREHLKNKIGKKTLRLTDEEVMSNTFIVLFAGYETTSTALGYMSHVLVNNPEMQDKIREEIKGVIAEDGELSYNSISKLKYLDQVWSETMRYYPPVTTFVSRTAINEIRYGDLKIPKGGVVQVPVSLLHKNPEYWADPWKFDPERFSKERRSEIYQMAYQPFGAGPRNCIGLRFAQMVAKLTLARILDQYRFVPGPKTEMGDITVTMKFVVMAPKKGVNLKVEKIA